MGLKMGSKATQKICPEKYAEHMFSQRTFRRDMNSQY